MELFMKKAGSKESKQEYLKDILRLEYGCEKGNRVIFPEDLFAGGLEDVL